MDSLPEPHVTDVADAATRWLSSLSPRDRETARWPFHSRERGNWHYAPRRRNGLALREMTEPQRRAARGLLASTLSSSGVRKAEAIMSLEVVLAETQRGGRHERDPLDYSFTVFGEPSRHPWGWRVEGHHLIVNVTVAGPGAVAVTPSFWGANPARIPVGERAGQRVLAGEYHLALELAGTLTPHQRAQAVFADRSVGNIITERGRARALQHPSGLRCTDLDDGQRGVLGALLREYLGNAAAPVRTPYEDVVHGDLAGLHLAWAGGADEGEPFYYRIHGPRLLIEFDCTADEANHIHSLWRDPVNDWGRDLLGEHYRHHHDED